MSTTADTGNRNGQSIIGFIIIFSFFKKKPFPSTFDEFYNPFLGTKFEKFVLSSIRYLLLLFPPPLPQKISSYFEVRAEPREA